MNRWLATLLLLGTAGTALAQAPAQEATDPMDRVEFLVGRWQGEGRSLRGPNVPPEVVRVTENVASRAAGAVLLLEGRGTVPGSEGEPEVVVHDALGVLSWDPVEEVYRLRAFRGGEVTDSVVEVGDNTMVWGFRDSRRGVEVRFTLTLDQAGRWTEIGEVDRGEDGWLRFFEMTLERVGKVAE